MRSIKTALTKNIRTLYEEFFDNGYQSVIVTGFGDVVGILPHNALGVCHRHAQTRGLNHGEVVEAVPADDEIIPRKPKMPRQNVHAACLVYAGGKNFQKVRLGTVYAESALKALRRDFLQRLKFLI